VRPWDRRPKSVARSSRAADNSTICRHPPLALPQEPHPCSECESSTDDPFQGDAFEHAGSDGTPRHHVCQIEDQAPLARMERRYEAILARLTDMVGILAEDGTWLWASPAFDEHLGVHVREGSPFGEYIHPDDIDDVRRAFARLVVGSHDRTSVTFRVHSDLERRWVWLETNAVDHREDPAIGGFVISARNVTERVALEEELRDRALHDPLTGLPNRLLLTDRIESSRARAVRTGRPFAVLYIDFDAFKEVNDSFGHERGDHVLRVVSARMRATLRSTDTLARLGGDEFVAVIEDLEGVSDLDGVCESILHAAAEPIHMNSRSISVSVSIGVAVSEGPDAASVLLNRADMAMYEAKRAGRNSWALHDDALAEQARLVFQTRQILHDEIDDSQLQLHYQPVVETRTGRVVGSEALARLVLPDGTLLAPSVFIGIAEETGAIGGVGRRVLRLATRDASRWAHDGWIAVNVSASQLVDPAFEGHVLAALADWELDPCRLVLEVTESTIIEADAVMLGAVASLHRHGVRFALDDFGTGFSSVDRLRHLPVEFVKIDQSFVHGARVGSAGDLAVIRAILAMANALHLTVVAEGIEAVEQLHQMTELRVPLVQGYLFGLPVPSLGPGAVPIDL
jgi:diguanylate cyclase (GGDEF)-like protein/PAS domain S-box-containing protein